MGLLTNDPNIVINTLIDSISLKAQIPYYPIRLKLSFCLTCIACLGMYYDTRHQSTDNKDYATYPSSFQTTLHLHTPATTSAIIVVDGTTQKLTWYVTSRVSTLDKKLSNVNVVTLNSWRAGTSGDIMTQFI